ARGAVVTAPQEAIIAEAEAERVAAETASREAFEAIAAANREASEAFLAEAKAREGVQVTESGLAYEVLTDGGAGATPAATDTVTVHYRGTLPDGTEFDSSYSRGEPTSFPLNRVIAGWTEGVALMNVGDKYKFYIPSDLAYGPGGAGGDIGPDQALVFEVELLDIETPADQGG
ncbi:MAG: FKBP-type peptidyl-prolyl cis-trans isomerase, partial [Pseudomonadota bacterium]